jgi:membrane protease YdiL (CAAX protease family)
MLLFTPLALILNNFIGESASLFIYYLLAIGIPFWIVYAIRKRETDETKFNFKIENKRLIPIIVVATLAFMAGISIPMAGLTSTLIPVPDFLADAFEIEVDIFSFLTIAVSAPILEELIFTGIILCGLLKRYSPIKSVLIYSLLFGIVHLNPWQFFTAFSLGLFMGWVYYKTRSLSLSIIIHFVNNFTIFLVQFIDEKFSDIDQTTIGEMTFMESYGGVENFVLITIGGIAVFALMIHFLRKEFKTPKNHFPFSFPCGESPEGERGFTNQDERK